MVSLVIQVLIVFSGAISAQAADRLTEQEILSRSGLRISDIVLGTQASLEQTVQRNESGSSCGLDGFMIDHYLGRTSALQNAPIYEFVVVTEVDGPAESCDNYERYFCYTSWKKAPLSQGADKWYTAYTECEEGNVH